MTEAREDEDWAEPEIELERESGSILVVQVDEGGSDRVGVDPLRIQAKERDRGDGRKETKATRSAHRRSLLLSRFDPREQASRGRLLTFSASFPKTPSNTT